MGKKNEIKGKGTLVLNFKTATDLVSPDKKGSDIDAFVSVQFGESEIQKTKLKMNTASPVWNESVQFEVPDVSELSTLQIVVIDGRVSLFGGKNEVEIGRLDYSPEDLEKLDIINGQLQSHEKLLEDSPSGKLYFDIQLIPTESEDLKGLATDVPEEK